MISESVKRAIVVEAGSGIGREPAKILAEKGCALDVMAKRLETALVIASPVRYPAEPVARETVDRSKRL